MPSALPRSTPPKKVKSAKDLSLSDAEQFVLHSCINGIKTADQLHLFIELISGYYVPFVPVCPDHKTPWHYIAPLYFETVSDVVVLATRAGSKTLSTAQLNATELLTKPNVEICSVGAIEKQAKKCYKYTNAFLTGSRVTEQFVQNSLMSMTDMANGASYQQIVGTIAGVNSPHPHKLRADEVELMKPEVVEEMKMVPHSTPSIRASFSVISSRKYLFGNMQEFVENADENGFDDVVAWCYKEISEPCPEERRGRKRKIYETPCIEKPDEDDEFVKFTAWEGCGTCALLPTCKGDLAFSTGFIKIDDAVKEFKRLDIRTWLAQKECRVPEPTGLVYPDFLDGEPQVGDYPYNPNLPTYCCNDFGYTEPWVNLWIQRKDNGEDNPPDWFIIAEYFKALEQSHVHHAAVKRTNNTIGCKPLLHVTESADPEEVDRMETAGFDAEPVVKGKIPHSLPFVRQRILSADGKRHLFVDRGCVNLRREFRRYHFPVGGGEIPADEFNHGLDALRYFFMWVQEQEDPVIL